MSISTTPLEELWIVDGVASAVRPTEDALYIKPLLNPGLLTSAGSVLQSLVLDNNVLTDLIESRRPQNTLFLERLLKHHVIELNPNVALLEQRQKFAGATRALADFRDYLVRTFNASISDANLAAFEKTLEDQKPAILSNMDTLAGYLSLTVYLYHQDWSIDQKVETLAGLVAANDLPVFQLHFYFAALVFLVRDQPGLFQPEDRKKVKEDMKIANNVAAQWTKIHNLANDLLFPALALSPAGVGAGTLIYPYAATRDRLCQLLLSQLTCEMVMHTSTGRANGMWLPMAGRLLDQQLGPLLQRCVPRRAPEQLSPEQETATRSIRSAGLRAFAQQYVEKAVAHRQASAASSRAA